MEGEEIGSEVVREQRDNESQYFHLKASLTAASEYAESTQFYLFYNTAVVDKSPNYILPVSLEHTAVKKIKTHRI